MKHISIQLLFAVALALAGASAAQAFTFESSASGDSGGVSRNYTDPVDRVEPKAGSAQHFGSQTQSDAQKDGFYLNFGGQTQSFDQRYNSSDYFNPMKR